MARQSRLRDAHCGNDSVLRNDIGRCAVFIFFGLWDELVSGKEDYKNDSSNITTVQKWVQALVPALVSFAYVFSTGAALQESGAPLAVCISVIPYVSFISMPIARLTSYYWPQERSAFTMKLVLWQLEATLS